MKDLGPLAAQQYKGEDGSEGHRRWVQRVERPAVMLVTTLDQLSVWGTPMGCSIVGKCAVVPPVHARTLLNDET